MKSLFSLFIYCENFKIQRSKLFYSQLKSIETPSNYIHLMYIIKKNKLLYEVTRSKHTDKKKPRDLT